MARRLSAVRRYRNAEVLSRSSEFPVDDVWAKVVPELNLVHGVGGRVVRADPSVRGWIGSRLVDFGGADD